ncbi:MAG: pantoate--beta-alanine ligase [Spirochaetes bacterium GWF1_31_7]|nr:MAG: pantoate--beta-alanine ligase [Spirochaetes bacterium GWE1_32_154]OHD49116.1 MAG: pantoate--beta-alanine ligase [Spirochaetes bacterium GWF1_31_7]OHD50298.1 MAG: pantoate--beta-alanine ligase [Spirochaetes bacterium GWE2_31_10]OHD82877.1 MAG: pantoate--beta-alanine ligase [Spirochaetes bacterium RIFOXYB1_FULL_32_8]HBD93914.1 pantoate--beta-alanine ligase [Spirochaetia bacterium]
MTVIHKIKELREFLNLYIRDDKSIGFVPTMGALHSGHCDLIKRSSAENDITVVSIFVNPIQFGKNEDFDTYPRTLAEDCKIAAKSGANIVFAPAENDMFKGGIVSYVDVENLQSNLCGLKRPGHFRGVCTIVAKFFNIVKPNKAYFGKKDIQQLTIIQKMTDDLNFDVQIIPCDIVREQDGLAMSSRNRYLSDSERAHSLVLSTMLKRAVEQIDGGQISSQKVINMIKDGFNAIESLKIDYVSIVNKQMEDVDTISNGDIIALAVFIGKTRLIDNHIIGEPVCF